MEETSLPLRPVVSPRSGERDPLDHLATSISGRIRIAGSAALGPFGGERAGPIITPASDVAAFPAVPNALVPTASPAPDTDVLPGQRSDTLNRVVNVAIAAIALFLLAPVCIIVALIVRMTSPGPVFYTQTRVGLDRRWRRNAMLHERRVDDLGGQPFTILKFRSMRVDAESNGQAVWATKHDSRVTPVGHFLRKSRLDEIPQLVNVLRGEMNIVGPRPERPSIVVRLRADIPEYPYRHRVKPGITGWAQINHSYDASIEDVRRKVQFDLEYIANQGFWFDLKIMVMTLPVMLFRRGAH